MNEALLAYEGKLSGAQHQLRKGHAFGEWPIDELPEWKPVIGSAIDDVGSAWEDFGRELCPVTWTLSWTGGAWACLTLGAEDVDTGRFRTSHDDVAVFFDRTAARQAGVPLPHSRRDPQRAAPCAQDGRALPPKLALRKGAQAQRPPGRLPAGPLFTRHR